MESCGKLPNMSVAQFQSPKSTHLVATFVFFRVFQVTTSMPIPLAQSFGNEAAVSAAFESTRGSPVLQDEE